MSELYMMISYLNTFSDIIEFSSIKIGVEDIKYIRIEYKELGK